MSEETVKTKSRASLYEATRMILLAAVGAASLAQDELTNFMEKLVERGEMAEGEARKLVKEIIDRREKLERERKQDEKRNSGTTATKADIEALTARIAELTRQVEDLKKGPAK